MAKSDTEAEAINHADPFSDRIHGPRTRARAQKEAGESPGRRRKGYDEARFSPEKSLYPTHASFAELDPAEFPSLNPRSTVQEVQTIKQERKLRRCAGGQHNPFVADDNDYLTAAGKAGRSILQQPVQPPAPSPKRSQHPTSSISQPFSPKSPEIVRSSFVTKKSTSGEIITWHQRANRARSRLVSDANDRSSSDEPLHQLVPPDLDPNTGSASPHDSLPVTPTHFSPSNTIDQHQLDGFVLGAFRGNNMAENVAPVANNDDATRGMPYYDRLKKTLKTSIKQKQELEETLTKIEQSIWNKEAAYLDETVAGNIMKGFDNYIKASAAPGSTLTGGGTASRKKATVSEQDRLFSKSSVGFWQQMTDPSPLASATSTPSHAPTPKGLSDHPTPTSTTSTKGPGWKKKKNADKDEESDGKQPNKRLKITFSRQEKD